MGERTTELRQEIDETRERLDDTVTRLGDRVEQVTEQAKRRAVVATTMTAVRKFPRLMVGAVGAAAFGYVALQTRRLMLARNARKRSFSLRRRPTSRGVGRLLRA